MGWIESGKKDTEKQHNNNNNDNINLKKKKRPMTYKFLKSLDGFLPRFVPPRPTVRRLAHVAIGLKRIHREVELGMEDIFEPEPRPDLKTEAPCLDGRRNIGRREGGGGGGWKDVMREGFVRHLTKVR